jgi:hypothetical protein
MYYLADFAKLTKAEKEKKKRLLNADLVKEATVYGGTSLASIGAYANRRTLNEWVDKEQEKHRKRVKAIYRKSRGLQKEKIIEYLKTPDEVSKGLNLADYQIENRLRSILKPPKTGKILYDAQDSLRKKVLNRELKKLGIPPLNSFEEAKKKYLAPELTPLGLELENKIKAVEKHTDISDPIQKQKVIDKLKKSYAKRGVTIDKSLSNLDTEKYRKLLNIENKKIKNKGLMLSIGLGFLAGSGAEMAGNVARNIALKKYKEERGNIINPMALGLGLIGTGVIAANTLSPKSRIVRAFLRKNKNGTVSTVKSHPRSLGGGK